MLIISYAPLPPADAFVVVSPVSGMRIMRGRKPRLPIVFMLLWEMIDG